MKILIAGCGKVGETLTNALSLEGYDLTLIDSSSPTLSVLLGKYDVIGVEGNCASLEILEEAAEHVKPGGYLVYGTCSVLDCENRENAEEFLKRHREFEPAPFPCGGKEHWMHQTFPADADCDGAFRARFRRKDLRP